MSMNAGLADTLSARIIGVTIPPHQVTDEPVPSRRAMEIAGHPDLVTS